jgi:hypothetical protein
MCWYPVCFSIKETSHRVFTQSYKSCAIYDHSRALWINLWANCLYVLLNPENYCCQLGNCDANSQSFGFEHVTSQCWWCYYLRHIISLLREVICLGENYLLLFYFIATWFTVFLCHKAICLKLVHTKLQLSRHKAFRRARHCFPLDPLRYLRHSYFMVC